MRAAFLVFLTFLNLCGPLIGLAAETGFYTNPSTGSNTAAGSTTGSPLVSGTNGNWNGSTTYIFSGATDLSGVAADMWASIYPDSATETTYVARITAVNDGTDTLTLDTTNKSGTLSAPASSATGISCKIGGVWKGPNAQSFFPLNIISGAMTNAAGDDFVLNAKAGDYALTEGTPLTSVTGSNAGDLLTTDGSAAPATGTGIRITFASGFNGLVSYTANESVAAHLNYYSIRVSSTTFQVASTYTEALAGTAIVLTGDGTGATVTPVPYGPTNNNAGPGLIRGYTTTPGDGALGMTLPNITGDGATMPFIGPTFGGTCWGIEDMQMGLNAALNTTGPNTHGQYMLATTSGGTNFSLNRVRFKNTWRTPFRSGGAGAYVAAYETPGCNVDSANGHAGIDIRSSARVTRSIFHHMLKVGDAGDPGAGFQAGATAPIDFDHCTFSHNGGQGLWNITGACNLRVSHSIFYKNGLSGAEFASLSGTSRAWFESNIFVGNGEPGIKHVNTTWSVAGRKNAFYNNGVDEQRTSVTCANTGDLFTKTSHTLHTGDLVTASGFSAGFTAGNYYAIAPPSTPNTFQLASTLANAIAGTAVAVTADGTGGVIAVQIQGGYAGPLKDSIALTGDPFTNGDAGDFSLNNTAGAGALCRAAGLGEILVDTSATTAEAGAYSSATTSTGASVGPIIPAGSTGSVIFGTPP